MKKVFQTWDSFYWLAPKYQGSFVKAKDQIYGWGSSVNKLHEIFELTGNENGAKLFDRF